MGPVPGEVDRGDVECVRGDARAVSADVVAPDLEEVDVEVEVVIVRGCEGELVVVVWLLVCACCEEDGDGLALPCCIAE